MKFSRQRELILQAVLAHKNHPTADVIYDELKGENPSLSLGTVYRNLALLEKNGMIRKVKVADHPDRYEGKLEDHAHFVCEKCGCIMDIDSDHIAQMRSEVSKELKAQINITHVIFKGVCLECRMKDR